MFGYSMISWGGGDEFVLIFALIFLIAPFVKSIDLKKTITGGSLTVAALLLISAMTPRPGPGIITNLEGLALMGSWLFGFLAYFLKRYGDPLSYNRNLLKVLLIFIFRRTLSSFFRCSRQFVREISYCVILSAQTD